MQDSLRRPHIISAGLVVLAAVAVLMAQQEPTTPGKSLSIALVDSQQVILESRIGKAAMSDLKALQQNFELELQVIRKEVSDLNTRINAGRASLTQDQLAELAKQMEDRSIALRRMQDDNSRQLKKKQNDTLTAIESKVMVTINLIAKEKGYSLVFRKFESGLVFADDTLDITALVIKHLDTLYPEGGK